ncbi:MAG: hypothetical protein K0Q97_582 [Bacillota bacterium]|jgi:hypothetical protein|nr:hypothetical protein [Bacillota bacterium]
MDFKLEAIFITMLFVILVSIQYTLNKILVYLKDIKTILMIKKNNKE